MYDSLHIVIHQEPSAGGRRGRVASGAPAGLRDPGNDTTLPLPDDPGNDTTLPLPDDPGNDTTLPLPDDPGNDTTLPLPDDPGNDTTLPLPDDPRLRWAGPGAVSVYQGLPPFGYGAGCGCGCACSCDDDKPARPEMLPRDYSGFVIVRVAPGVALNDLEELWHVADDNHLDGLKAVLELETEWQAGGGTGNGGGEEPGSAEGGSGVKLGLRDVLRRQRRAEGKGGGAAGGGDAGGAAGGGEAAEPTPGLRTWPLIAAHGCLSREALVDQIRELETAARSRRLAPLHSLTRYWRVDLRPYPDKAQEVVDRFNALAEVELAYRELAAADPGGGSSTYAAAGTRFAADQGYLNDAPLGIGARWAWAQLGTSPKQMTICDLEQRWHPGHQALPAGLAQSLYYGANRDDTDEEDGHGNHGTAVLGQLAAVSNAAVDGGAAPVGKFALSSHYLSKDEPDHPFAGTNGHVAAAIVYTLLAQGGGPAHLTAGDVLLLEVQRGGLPTEVDAADLDAIRLASALGIIVVEAGGNGNRNLDAYVDPDTGFSLRRGASSFRDSGAILVGAAWSVLPHDRSPFSNYGSRLDCFAWGDSVTSCGYGDLAGDQVDDYYTNTFSGTSSASPIIAAAAALVQAFHPATLDPLQMRKLLSNPATGTRQGSGVAGSIGVMPDLRRLVRDELQLVPQIYLRRHPGDDGSTPGKDDPVSASNDLMVLEAGKPTAVWDGPRADQPAPGGEAVPGGGPYDVHVRLRNRGVGQAEVEVRVFASPAATLIAPEQWQLLTPQPLPKVTVPQGGGPVEAASVHFAPPPLSGSLPDGWSVAPPYSFLAVARPAEPAAAGYPSTPVERGDGLPPSGAYFDWLEYRRFLRSPGVAWRNVHHVGPQAIAHIPFLLAGAPGRDRRFTLEVVQRLPAGVKVHLDVAPALAAKLAQAQPLLVKTLPSPPRCSAWSCRASRARRSTTSPCRPATAPPPPSRSRSTRTLPTRRRPAPTTAWPCASSGAARRWAASPGTSGREERQRSAMRDQSYCASSGTPSPPPSSQSTDGDGLRPPTRSWPWRLPRIIMLAARASASTAIWVTVTTPVTPFAGWPSRWSR